MRNNGFVRNGFVLAFSILAIAAAASAQEKRVEINPFFGYSFSDGVTVDPFILGLTQQVAGGPPVAIAALAVVVAAAANNLMKGIYAVAFGPRGVGVPVLLALVCLAAASLVLFQVL